MSEEASAFLSAIADIVEEIANSPDGDRVIDGLALLAAKMKNGFVAKGFSTSDAQEMTCALMGAIVRAE